MSADRVNITVLSGKHRGGEAAFLAESVLSIGNDGDSDVVLSDLRCNGEGLRIDAVSSQLIKIYCIGAGCVLEDEMELAPGEAAAVQLPVSVSCGNGVELYISGDAANEKIGATANKVSATKTWREHLFAWQPPRFLKPALIGCLLVTTFGVAHGESDLSGGTIGPSYISYIDQSKEEAPEPATPTVSIEDKLKIKLKELGLAGIEIKRTENVVYAVGSLSKKEQQIWRDVPRWFDEVGGTSFILLSDISDKFEDTDIPTRPRSVWLSAEPYIVDSAFNKVSVGGTTSEGWIVRDISGCCLRMEKMGRSVEITLE